MNDIQKEPKGLINKSIYFFLKNKIIVFILLILIAMWGIIVSPFEWNFAGLPHNPVPVDAIPDIGENMQIVFTKWSGRSPQDIEDQVSYPLTVSLLGVPGVKSVRSYSMFGFSSVYVIFDESVDFYWSRSRLLEKLNSLPSATLPIGVNPILGPDATALGQVFWYNLEGQDKDGNPTGGWDLNELRTVQDWSIKYSLMSAIGVSEVASIGGFVQEYQVDIDPDAMRANGVGLDEIIKAVKMSNKDVGARSIEINKVEYVIRGIGFVKNKSDLENAVIKVNNNIPICVWNVAKVTLGPALRRGILDKGGAEVVGGVVVVRYGENPLQTIKNVKKKIAEISNSLPKKTLKDGTVSQIKIVPFYDRTGLIYETLGTLKNALFEEILVTVIVVIFLIGNPISSLLVSGLLPLAVLMCFIGMKVFSVDANIVALSGIAIAIGTMVDMGIILCENIISHLEASDGKGSSLKIVYDASREVAGAIITAISTTIVSFLPVFTMTAAEGKLFKPLAYTKTFALISSVIIAVFFIPPIAHMLFQHKKKSGNIQKIFYILTIFIGAFIGLSYSFYIGILVIAVSIFKLVNQTLPVWFRKMLLWIFNIILIVVVMYYLTLHWLPLGPDKGIVNNFIFIAVLVGSVLLFYRIFQLFYTQILTWCLNNKLIFLSLPFFICLFGIMAWLGADSITKYFPKSVRKSTIVRKISKALPGLGKEFMPSLDEGSFLFMPTTMPHASIVEAYDVLKKQDMMISRIPEVSEAVGKLGRVESPLDPAPISMIETIINYKNEYKIDSHGNRLSYRFDSGKIGYFRDESGNVVNAPDGKKYKVNGVYQRDSKGRLIPDQMGKPFRQWRLPLLENLNPNRSYWKGIQTPRDIWDEIIEAARLPGTTSAPVLQPISARIVMLQSGMRAPMGLKVKGPSLESIDKAGILISEQLMLVPSIEPESVSADRVVGKPYLEIHIDRKKIARYGIMLQKVQDVIEVAIGGKRISTTIEGRERYPVRVRYMRELRDSFESIEKILVAASDGSQIPLIQLADIKYIKGPQVIKSEDTFLVSYVLFDKKENFAEVDVVNQAKKHLENMIKKGKLNLPVGVSYIFAGSYENQVRSEKRMKVVIPVALIIIFLILYLQFRSTITSMLVFSGIGVAWAGGFIMLWLYAQPWFMDFSVFETSMRELFRIHPVNLSVAVWVGFLALFGIATDDGVVIASYLKDSFDKNKPGSIDEIRNATVKAGNRRVRACLMTTATTVLALIPILTSSGRGSDIMIPMALPSFGGMFIEIITMLVVPVLYCFTMEIKLKFNSLSEYCESDL
ncbi:efflux RND transporter permease subunit [bacterium]|nr:efflux RND transporter permease subunit [bacterium]